MDALTPPQRLARLRDLIVFHSPQRWRWWPFLPVARPALDGNGKQCGVLYDACPRARVYSCSAIIFLADLFFLPETEAELLMLPQFVYDDTNEIAEAGWTVT